MMQGLGAPERIHFLPMFARQGVGLPTAPSIAVTKTSTSVTITVTEPSNWGTGTGKSYVLSEGTDGIYWPIETPYTYPQTTITKTSLVPGSTHWYRLGAITSLGTRWSSEVKVVLPDGVDLVLSDTINGNNLLGEGTLVIGGG